MKLTIEYDPMAGYVWKDGEAQGWVDDIIHSVFFAGKKLEDRDDFVVSVASALIVDCFRLRLAEGVLKEDQIQFKYNGEVLDHNKYGRINYWPPGFCDTSDKIQTKLIEIGMRSWKDKKKCSE